MSQVTYSFSVGSVYLLDDDPRFLRHLRGVLDMRSLPVRTFAQPLDCLRELVSNICVWVTSLSLQSEIIDRWREGRDEARLVLDVLDYWGRGLHYERCAVLVLDYQMPGLNGMELLQQVPQLPAQRLMLTGQADERIACDLFNDGLIQQFLRKGEDPTAGNMAGLRERVVRLRLAALTDESRMWGDCLTFGQKEQIKRDELALAALGLERNWVEHVALPSPLGFLARDRNGRVEFLSLETTARTPIEDAVIVKAQLAGLPNSSLYQLPIHTDSQYQMTLDRYMKSSSGEMSWRFEH